MIIGTTCFIKAQLTGCFSVDPGRQSMLPAKRDRLREQITTEAFSTPFGGYEYTEVCIAWTVFKSLKPTYQTPANDPPVYGRKKASRKFRTIP